jgi:choline dehydrogenase-like flavoprotein
MIIESPGLDPSAVFDCCVVGGGPAGATLALRLAQLGKSVALLEGGDLDFSDESQAVYRAEVRGDPYFDLEYARLRYFGGTSGHWNGWCRTLDPIDFESKPAFPEARWPISKADLDPFLSGAAAILELEPQRPDRPVGQGVNRIFFSFSPPVRFGEKYREMFEHSPNIVLSKNSNVFRFEVEDDAVTAAEVLDYAGGRTRVRARNFVLACGGIENSRILLHGNAAAEGRLVPEDRALGRYWMEHPHFTLGSVVLFQRDWGRRFFALAPETQRELGILACGLRYLPEAYSGTRKTIADLLCIAPALGEWALRQTGRRLLCGGRLHAAWEMEPRAENRVSLSDSETDQFGVPRAVLTWRKTERDLATARETAMRFGAYLAEADLGRVRLQDWVRNDGDWPELDELGGYHHMGGTRMSDDPATGVVDRDMKVWGRKNLYVAGSSVFPSGGHANPTLTIVQLSLRLADHLARQGA